MRCDQEMAFRNGYRRVWQQLFITLAQLWPVLLRVSIRISMND